MVFPFPAISSACPLCDLACGATYRGYYRRWGVIPEAPFLGWVAIRTGFCKYYQRRFALFPEFLVPFRSFSRQAFFRLTQSWIQRGIEMISDVDLWFSNLEQEVYLAVSTLYFQLRLVVRELRLGTSRLDEPFYGTSVWDLREVSPPVFEACISDLGFGLSASSRINRPP